MSIFTIRMKLNLDIIPITLLEQYCSQVDDSLQTGFNALHDSELSIENFSFYTSVSAVFSSKIEGEKMELDSYIKHKRLGAHFLPDYTRKVDDLYDAYLFAQKTKLSADKIMNAHAIITKHILQKAQQGNFRSGNMVVVTSDGKIEYTAASPGLLKTEMEKLFGDIETLLAAELNFKEVFYFASMIHLVFVKIHPFEDGNGRTARLLEKWFIAQKLGTKAWYIQSEKNYYEQHQTYYDNIRHLGFEYATLDYSQALPFLLMLGEGVR